VVKFIAFDLETTGVDVETAEVVQAAAVEACLLQPYHSTTRPLVIGEATTQLFYAASIPEGATAVHGIRAEDVVDKPRFDACVDSFTRSLIASDVVTVSFNGCGYDIPIVARYVSQFGVTRSEWETRLRARHIDAMRLWWRVRGEKLRMPWECGSQYGSGGCGLSLTADMFAGSLAAVHGFYTGSGFENAHDAGNDCRATLTVLGEMLSHVEGLDVDTAIKWSNEPLPGDVDFSGKFKWQGERCVITIGKQAGTRIEQVDRGFLQWMLVKDFATDTKDIVRAYLTTGAVPQRVKS
jgi:DNA polymerase III epsilon subunit-like protein